MRRITSMQSQWKAEHKEGEVLCFEECKGGYFSSDENYCLKVRGKTSQSGMPTPAERKAIECVKAGSVVKIKDDADKIISSIVVPCDLYRDDIWYPYSGKVEHNTVVINITSVSQLAAYGNVARYRHNVNVLPYYDGANTPIPYSNTFVADWNVIDKVSLLTNDSVWVHGSSQSVYFAITPKSPWHIWSVEEMNNILQEATNSGTPVTVAYKRNTPYTQQCEPQLCFGSAGTVNVLQEGEGLAAGLDATMLVRRRHE